jgi:hypothetical protein
VRVDAELGDRGAATRPRSAAPGRGERVLASARARSIASRYRPSVCCLRRSVRERASMPRAHSVVLSRDRCTSRANAFLAVRGSSVGAAASISSGRIHTVKPSPSWSETRCAASAASPYSPRPTCSVAAAHSATSIANSSPRAVPSTIAAAPSSSARARSRSSKCSGRLSCSTMAGLPCGPVTSRSRTPTAPTPIACSPSRRGWTGNVFSAIPLPAATSIHLLEAVLTR